MKHSELADLARKGFRPRVVNGVVTTLKPVPDGTALTKDKSLREQLAETTTKADAADAKAEANASEIDKLKPKPVKP